jgi:PPM family protein phosphatase
MELQPTLIFGDDVVVAHGAHHAVSVINKRTTQQDVAYAGRRLCVVCDGMGGHANGAEAAQAAVGVFAHSDVALDVAALDDLVAEANAAVIELSGEGYRNPGTTLVAVVAEPDGSAVNGVWVGDSRAYIVDADGAVTRVTEDHSDFYGGLTRCLGDHGHTVSAEPDRFRVEVGSGLRILLCTDGVSGPLTQNDDEETEEVVIGRLLAAGLEPFVRAAASTGTDNATAVLVDVDQLARSGTDPN